MLFALYAMTAAGEFAAGSTVVAVVTGAETSSSSRSSRHSPALIV
jgi:hypothetical protein